MASILAQTERWHRELANIRRYAGTDLPLTTNWNGLQVSDFMAGTDDRVRITQLNTLGLLVAEGRALNHCVASYLQSCMRGRCGIFSLTIDGVRAITLEVSAGFVVVQARGKHNRSMAADERFWVTKWATDSHLTLSKHI